jgi:predicted xylose isomerase-like sugar epimerase
MEKNTFCVNYIFSPFLSFAYYIASTKLEEHSDLEKKN